VYVGGPNGAKAEFRSKRSSLSDVGMTIHEEDRSRLSPLGYRYIHLFGRYDVTLSADMPPEGFRALRQAAEPVEGDESSG